MSLNVTLLAGKELELVQEVERCWPDTVGLTSTHSLGSGAQLLDLHYSVVARGNQQQAAVDSLTACQLSRQVLAKKGEAETFTFWIVVVTPTVVKNKNVTGKLSSFFRQLSG